MFTFELLVNQSLYDRILLVLLLSSGKLSVTCISYFGVLFSWWNGFKLNFLNDIISKLKKILVIIFTIKDWGLRPWGQFVDVITMEGKINEPNFSHKVLISVENIDENWKILSLFFQHLLLESWNCWISSILESRT